MSLFKIHFFKERKYQIEIEQLVYFFEKIPNFSIESTEEHLKFNYQDEVGQVFYSFVMLPKSIVPNIQRINPKYLDLNFHVEMPILMSNYVYKSILNIIRKFTFEFEVFIFSEMLQDVMPYKEETLLGIFNMIKEAYIKRNPALLNDFIVLDTRLVDIYNKYSNSLLELHQYFREDNIYVPHLLLLKNRNSEFKTAIEWKEKSSTVFPAAIDYVLYKNESGYHVYHYKDVKALIEKYITDVPGFTIGTFYTIPKYMKKINKLLRKAKLETVENAFTKVHLKHLIDL